MNDREIRSRYETQEENKETVKKWIKLVNQRDLKSIETKLRSIPQRLLDEINISSILERWGVNESEFQGLRNEEHQMYEKFTGIMRHYREKYGDKVVSKAAVKQAQNPKPKRDIEREIKMWHTHNQQSLYNFTHLIAEGNDVIGSGTLTHTHGKTGTRLKTVIHTKWYVKEGHILFTHQLFHRLAHLVQLGKFLSEDDNKIANDYIESLRKLGFIE